MGYKYINIRQLELFVKVAEHKSFSDAAHKMTHRMSPSAVILQIKALEKHLKNNTRLFERKRGKKAVLTPDGEALLELVKPIIRDFHALPSNLAKARNKAFSAPIRIVTHSSVMTSILPGILKDFRARFADCELSIANRPKNDIINMMRAGDADIGIGSPPPASAGLSYHPIAKIKRMLIMPKNHPLAHRKNIELKDMSGLPLLAPIAGSTTRAIIERAFESRNLPYTIAMEVSGKDAVKEYVRIGMGITVLNECYISPQDRKDLVVRDVSAYFGNAERGIITKNSGYLSKPAKEFIALLIAKFK